MITWGLVIALVAAAALILSFLARTGAQDERIRDAERLISHLWSVDHSDADGITVLESQTLLYATKWGMDWTDGRLVERGRGRHK